MKERSNWSARDGKNTAFDVTSQNVNFLKTPQVIPPKSIVRLSRYDDGTPEWRKSIGRTFRVGYYSRRYGLGCIWLVNGAGEYEQTTDRQTLLMYFKLVRLSHETDYFGTQRAPLRPLPQRLSAS